MGTPDGNSNGQGLNNGHQGHARRAPFTPTQDPIGHPRSNYGQNQQTMSKPRKKKKKVNRFVETIKKKSMTWYIVMLAATAGLIWQLQDIMTLYFEYQTVTELVVDVPDNITAPALSLCFPYDELANRDQVNKAFPELAKKADNDTLHLADLSAITLKQIFEFTPPIENMIVYCLYRVPLSYTRLSADFEACRAFFDVQKYYKQQYACYMFVMTASKGVNYTFDYIQNSLVSPGMFFEIALKPELFVNVTSVQAVIHAFDLKPRGNKAFPVAFSRVSSTVDIDGEEIVLKDSYFFLSYSMFINKLLPHPYESNCINYEDVDYESQEDCIDRCVTEETIKVKTKVPFTAVSNDSTRILQHVSVEDNEDEVFATQIAKIKLDCSEKCKQPNCNDEIYVTKFIRSSSAAAFAFRVYVANEPTLTSTYKEKISTSEFLVYLLSCFGIWYGLSFYHFIEFFDWVVKKCAKHRQEKKAREKLEDRRSSSRY